MPASFVTYQGAPLVDAELPSALGQIKAPPTPTTDRVKPAPYHRHWDFLIMYVTWVTTDIIISQFSEGVIFAQQYIDFSIKSKKIATPMVKL